MRSILRIAVLAGLTAALGAQRLAHSVNDDGTFAFGATVGSPSTTVALKFVPPLGIQAAAAEVFTGNGAGASGLAIWSHDGAGDRPLAPLGPPGTWTMVPAFCWQGAALPAPVALAGGATYWLVWDFVPFSHGSVSSAPAPTNVDVRLSGNGGATWSAAQTWAAKLRIYETSVTGAIAAVGAPKAGSNGNPAIGVTGWPSVGNPLDVWLDDTSPATPCFLLLGSPATIAVPPLGTAWVDPVAVIVTSTIYHPMPQFRGTQRYTVWIPNTPAAAGVTLAFQWGILDPFAAAGLAHTAGVNALLQ